MEAARQVTVCTGTLLEHVIGDPECTDEGCATAHEHHWLVVSCVEVACRCSSSAAALDETAG